VDIVRALKAYPIKVTLYDPWANPAEVMDEYGLNCCNELLSESMYDAIVLGVAHNEFLKFDMSSFKKANPIVYDIKRILKNDVDGRL
jgi:UDP-N-acetyl-D-galactosamine dehydrogenase